VLGYVEEGDREAPNPGHERAPSVPDLSH